MEAYRYGFSRMMDGDFLRDLELVLREIDRPVEALFRTDGSGVHVVLMGLTREAIRVAYGESAEAGLHLESAGSETSAPYLVIAQRELCTPRELHASVSISFPEGLERLGRIRLSTPVGVERIPICIGRRR